MLQNSATQTNSKKLSVLAVSRKAVQERDKDNVGGTSNISWKLSQYHSAYTNTGAMEMLDWLRVTETHSFTWVENGNIFLHFGKKSKPPRPGLVGVKLYDKANSAKPADMVDMWLPKKVKELTSGHRYQLIRTSDSNTFILEDIGEFEAKGNERLSMAVISITHRPNKS